MQSSARIWGSRRGCAAIRAALKSRQMTVKARTGRVGPASKQTCGRRWLGVGPISSYSRIIHGAHHCLLRVITELEFWFCFSPRGKNSFVQRSHSVKLGELCWPSQADFRPAVWAPAADGWSVAFPAGWRTFEDILTERSLSREPQRPFPCRLRAERWGPRCSAGKHQTVPAVEEAGTEEGASLFSTLGALERHESLWRILPCCVFRLFPS